MGLQIQFVDRTVRPARETRRFQLREDDLEPGIWIAPEVLLLPVKNLPLLTHIEVRVAGTPETVASRIQSAFFTKAFAKPEQLSEPRSLGSGRIHNAGMLPAQALCEMRVTVRYFDADAKGRPAGVEQTETLTCAVTSGPAREVQPELSLRNRELVLQPEVSVPLVVEVRHPRETAPALALQHPETVAAPDDPALAKLRPFLGEIRKALEATLALAPSRSDMAGTAEFRWMLSIRLSQQAKQALAEGDGLAVPLLATLKGATSKQWQIKLEAASKAFPGWVVIDFGTTNSTVTVYDNWDHTPPEGLPEEQEESLLARFLEWVSKTSATEAFGSAGRGFDADWARLRTQAASALTLASADLLTDWVRADPSKRLYQAISQIESNMRLASEPFQRLACHVLHSMYRETLLIPPLRQFRLFPVKLDPNERDDKSVASEIEIQSVRKPKEDTWPQIRMGRAAQKARLDALSKSDEAGIQSVLQRFHPSPKRYFGTDRPAFVAEFDGQQESITVDQLMRAGWEKLLEFAERAKQEEQRFSVGPLRKAVITYPTVAPPSVRQTIQKILRDLKIADVRTDYDEAVAAAIFYFMREYSSFPELGLESFKARSRPQGQAGWSQNVLVFDIGGGTTDLALIRLTLTEEAVFAPGEERGAGGRYYKVTPQLLSSSGHMQLGGELMTLRIFRLLKGMVADRLLQLAQEGRLTCDPIKAILEGGLPESATPNGRYRNGWIRETLETSESDSNTPRLREALNLAERVLPTRWGEGAEGRTARLQTFYTLWEYSEKAKIQLGSKPRDGVESLIRDAYRLEADQFAALLDPTYSSYQAREPKKDFVIQLAPDKMERAIGKVVEEAVKIAQGALERLPAGERVDWLILSGQSCNLALVDRKIRESFRETDKFIWNPDRVTFLPDYAKLSTSVGACYAENLRRNRFAAKGSKEKAKKGINTLYFDVNNLFSYLPCSFVIPGAGGPQVIFKAGEELFDLQGLDIEEQQRGLTRSRWMVGTALNIDVSRQDYKGGTERKWGNFDGQALAGTLQMSDNQWREQVQLQFEIDHRQAVDVLLFRESKNAPRPHRQFTGNESRLDLAAEMPKAGLRLAQAKAKPGQDGNAPAPPAAAPSLFDEQKRLGWTLAIGSGMPPSGAKPGKPVFDEHQALETMALDPATGVSLGIMLSKECLEIDDFQEDGNNVVVWGKPAGPTTTTWVPLGQLERPGEKPVFRRRYRLTLDERGILRLHSGEPSYRESFDPQCLTDNSGRVFRRALEATKRDTDEDRNPFTGKH